MKAVYQAAREILYPNHTTRIASSRFADGQMDYPSKLAQALMDFEQANRGHRDVLESKALHIDADALVFGTGDCRLPRTIRRHLKTQAYNLCRAVVQLGRVSSDKKTQKLLAAPETQGYFPAFAFEELKHYCGNTTTSGLPDNMGITAMRVAVRAVEGVVPVLHVRVERADGAHAKRAIALSAVSPTSLGGVRSFIFESLGLIQSALRDTKTWPEFANKAPEQPRRAEREPQSERSSSVKPAAATSPVEAPAVSEEDTELSARLQRHMQDFISMYSPAVQSYLAANWDKFRPAA